MKVYHGTTAKAAALIVSEGFRTSSEDVFNLQKMPSDLGVGIYTYGDDGLGVAGTNIWNPKKNAMEYARKYKSRQSHEFSVITVTLRDDETVTILDLDQPVNQRRFTIIRDRLQYRVNQLYRKIPMSGAKMRNNSDGILIELAFNTNALPPVDIVVKQTYTDFVGATISNFANGREFVIRNQNIILDRRIV